ncbi:beta strand repeat-containing protein [Yoonia sp.]|uniref:beta strand repeat-containing protein n=1 Tax=Yoonia sp. TaxID=2212373 RepID=UPI003F70B5AC
MAATDTLLDGSTTDNDVLNVTLTGATTITTMNIETINLSYVVAAADFTGANTGTTTYNVSGAVAGVLSTPASAATIALNDYDRVLTVEGLTLTGTTAAGSAESVSISLSGASYGTTAATQTGVTIDGTDGEQLETLNIASNGSSANSFALAFQNTETVGTYTITGAQDLTMRVADAKVSGATINATGNTGTVAISLDTGADITVNAANWTGVDNIVLRDSDTTAGAATLNSTASGQNVVVANSVSTLTVAATGATYTAPAAAASLELNGTSTTAGVTVTTYAVQNAATLNLSSLGLASSTSTTAANTISNLDGDFTTINITGDTSLRITDLDIEAVQTATTATTARAVVLDASAMTGNAFVNITASADSKVSYSITGTAGADTIVMNASGGTVIAGAGNDAVTSGTGADTVNLGAGTDSYVVSFGADTLTLGAGIDTVDINASGSDASAQSSTFTNLATYTHVGTVHDDITIVVNGIAFSHTVTAGADVAADAAATQIAGALRSAILNATGVTLSVDAVDTDLLVLTGAADGTAFTVSASFVDDSAAGDPSAAFVISTTAGAAAGDVATTITDFAAGDIIDTVGLTTLGTGGYVEGLANVSNVTTHGVIVITDASYATVAAAEDAVQARTAVVANDVATTTAGIVVFLNSTTGTAQAFLDNDIDTDAGLADSTVLFTFSNITNLTDLASIMSADSFVI